MGNLTYTITALMCAFLTIVIFFSDREVLNLEDRASRMYSYLAKWLFFFFLQDALWGVFGLQVYRNDIVLFASTSVFYFSTAITALMWVEYAIAYLDRRIRHGKIYRGIATVLFIAMCFAVIVNIKIPIIFNVTSDGIYEATSYRFWNFLLQYFVYFGTAILSFVASLRSRGEERARYYAVLSSVMPILICGIAQIMFPYMPFHSIGLLFGICIIHNYVVRAEREEHHRQDKNGVKRVLHTLTRDFDIILQVNLDTEEELLYRANGVFQNDFPEFSNEITMAQRVKNYADKYIIPAGQAEFIRAMDKDVIWERVGEGHTYVIRHLDSHETRSFWYETRITRMTDVGIDRIVLICFRNINDEVIEEQKKSREEYKREAELLKISFSDELTKLLNRHAFEQAIKEILNEPANELWACISLDVNGLKETNDKMGHAAGDELLKGAADCIRQCFGTYGRAYRIGGDEFIVLMKNSKENIEALCQDFEEVTRAWEGVQVESLSAAYGFVTQEEFPELKIKELLEIADRRMYDKKAQMKQHS